MLQVGASTIIFAVWLALSSSIAIAQASADPDKAQAVPQDENATYHLKVFANRMQIPTLVMGRNEKPVPNLRTDSFAINLDNGPTFSPSSVRLEGDDSVSLAVLIDASGSEPSLVKRSADALASLSPKLLTSRDHVSIFAADCRMFRTRWYVPAEQESIRSGVREALAAPKLHGDKDKGCDGSFRLWDYLSYVVAQTGDLPGRRVLLIISAAVDSGSKINPADVSLLAARHAIAIFSLKNPQDFRRPSAFRSPATYVWRGTSTLRPDENAFERISAENGGMALETDSFDLSARLALVIGCVRNRYILEFPRPDRGAPGLHSIRVTVPGNKNLLVRTVGSSVPLPSADVEKDPSILPSKRSQAVFGSQRPAEPKH